MPSCIPVLVAAGALCAACSAPPATAALPPGHPANPAAPTLPFVRPANVLAAAEPPATSIPPTAMDMAGMSHGGGSAMPAMPMAQAGPPRPGGIPATGTVNGVDPAKRSLNVTHQPIRTLGWPTMTMDFPVAPSVDLGAVKPGDRIDFQLGQAGPDGMRRIERVTPGHAP